MLLKLYYNSSGGFIYSNIYIRTVHISYVNVQSFHVITINFDCVVSVVYQYDKVRCLLMIQDYISYIDEIIQACILFEQRPMLLS